MNCDTLTIFTNRVLQNHKESSEQIQEPSICDESEMTGTKPRPSAG